MSQRDWGPALVFTIIVCLPTVVGLTYRLFH